MRRLLSPSQLWHLAQSKHAPLYALCRLRVAVDACVRASTRRHSDGFEQNLFNITEGMLGAITGCERIKKTPCPPGYVAIMRLLMIIWLVLLPFTLGTELKWGIVAITSVTAWTMLQASSSVT